MVVPLAHVGVMFRRRRTDDNAGVSASVNTQLCVQSHLCAPDDPSCIVCLVEQIIHATHGHITVL